MADDDDDDDLDNLDWDELYRRNFDEMIEWARFLRAVVSVAVDEAIDTIMPPPPKLEDLLAAFTLEDEAKKTQAIAYYNASEGRAAVHEAAEKGKEAVDQSRVPGGPAEDDLPGRAADAAKAAASAVLGKLADATAPVDAVHVSDAAIPFKNWHIRDIPASYVAPYNELISDPSIVENIKKARSMLAVVPHGAKGVVKNQPAGTMAWQRYPPKKTAGWFFIDDPKGAYAAWCFGQIHERYDQAQPKARDVDTDPSATDAQKMTARVPMRTYSACHAVMRQEGLPSAINTYDGTVLTWCSGLAAPGKLPKLFHRICKDPNVFKAMYLCGFLYQGTPTDPAYQIVDIKRLSSVYYRGNYATQDVLDPRDPARVKYPKGTPDYTAFKVLQKFVDQIELVYLLIMLARDPLTRDTVFKADLAAIEEMVGVGSPEKIATEALYVFIAEVKHNWDIRENMVEWARSKFTPAEATLAWPSEEHDQAVAKGVFRYVLRNVQRGAWKAAVGELKVRAKTAVKKKVPPDPVDFYLGVMVNVVYSFDRLVDNYWIPMQTGTGPKGFKPHTIGESTLTVPGLLVPRAAATGSNDVFVFSTTTGTSFSIGDNTQCDFLFTNPKFQLSGFDTSGNVVLKNDTATWTVTPDGVLVP
jgi:hypothetical protein